MFCRAVILCLSNCIFKTIQVKEEKDTFFDGRMMASLVVK
jgi:hypothetical protein